MASPRDRLRVLDARLQRADPYPPLSATDLKIGGLFVVLGLASLVVALTVLAGHAWLQLPFFASVYFGIWPVFGRLVMRCTPGRYARRLLWLGSIPGFVLLWPFRRLLHSPLSSQLRDMLPPDEKLMGYEAVGALTTGSMWVVSDQALYVWPIAAHDPDQRMNISRYPFRSIRGINEETVLEPGLVRRSISVFECDEDEPLVVEDLFPISQTWRVGDLIRAGMLAAANQSPGEEHWSDE